MLELCKQGYSSSLITTNKSLGETNQLPYKLVGVLVWISFLIKSRSLSAAAFTAALVQQMRHSKATASLTCAHPGLPAVVCLRHSREATVLLPSSLAEPASPCLESPPSSQRSWFTRNLECKFLVQIKNLFVRTQRGIISAAVITVLNYHQALTKSQTCSLQFLPLCMVEAADILLPLPAGMTSHLWHA